MDVIKKIEEYRIKKGWTVYRLAAEAGISQSALTNMYSRGTLPSMTTLQNICEAFGITLSQFFQENESYSILTPEEESLVENYRLMSTDNKKLLIDLSKKLI